MKAVTASTLETAGAPSTAGTSATATAGMPTIKMLKIYAYTSAIWAQKSLDFQGPPLPIFLHIYKVDVAQIFFIGTPSENRKLSGGLRQTRRKLFLLH